MNDYNEKEIFELSLNIGSDMIESGGEIKRASDSIKRINHSYGAKKTEVWAVPSMIMATVTTKSGIKYTSVKEVGVEEIDLNRLHDLNNISRRLCNRTETSIAPSNRKYSLWIEIICIFLATSAFCIYFGGTLIDALLSGIIGIVISYYRGEMKSDFSSVFLDSTVAGILSFLPSLFGLDVQPDKIMIGTIMLLVPGLTVGNSMRDMLGGDIFAGVMRLIEAIFTALAIAFGYSVAVLIFGSEYL